MGNSMWDVVFAVYFIILGALGAVFSKKAAKQTSDFYYKLLHHRYSEKMYQISFIIAGTAFVVFGVLALLGVIKFRN